MKALPLIFLIIVLFDAWTDAMRPHLIKHFRGAVLYFIACSVLCIVKPAHWYHVLFLAALTRSAWFDPAFNAWTGNPFAYNGDKKNKKRSFVDKVEDWIIKKTNISILWLKCAYIAAWAAYTGLYLFKWTL